MGDHEGVKLTRLQARALAARMVIDHLTYERDWLDWGNVPELAEDSFRLVTDAVGEVVDDLRLALRRYEVEHDIDSQQLWREVQ